jgi:DnaK suppressor protein
MQEGQNRKTSSLSILAIAGVEPYQEKPGEEYMNEAQLAHFKRILEAWRNQLRDEVDRTVSHMQDEAANFPDPVDRAAQEEEFSLELRNRDRERKLIKKIEKTLKKSKTKISATANPAALRLAFAVWKRVRPPICASTAKRWRKFAKNRWRANPAASLSGGSLSRLVLLSVP